MKQALSPKELAEAIGVSESSLRRWVDGGAVQTSRTRGGHRRIPIAEAMRFIRESGSTIVRPELLGLEQVSGGSSVDGRLYEALLGGRSGQAASLMVSLHVSGQSVAAIFDGPVRAAMHRMGELWRHDERGILVEHRATDACLAAMAQLRQLIAAPGEDAPVAVGGAPEGDPYLIPTTMAAMVLTDIGYRAIQYGAQTPIELLRDAAREHGARLAWLSLTTEQRRDKLGPQISRLAAGLGELGASLVIGGQRAGLANTRTGVQMVQSMAELAAFARGLLQVAKARATT